MNVPVQSKTQSEVGQYRMRVHNPLISAWHTVLMGRMDLGRLEYTDS
jgi:hypothetical protein